MTRGMSLGNHLALVLGRYAPGLVRRTIRSYAASFNSNPERFLAVLVRQLPVPDRQLMEDPALREAVCRDLREAYRQGGDGHAHDAALAMTSRSWGFELGGIMVPVHLWHGEADTVVSRSMAEHLITLLPDCQAHFVPNAGHLLTEYEDVVKAFGAVLEGYGE